MVGVGRREDRAAAVTGRTGRTECVAERRAMLEPRGLAVISRCRAGEFYQVWCHADRRPTSFGDR